VASVKSRYQNLRRIGTLSLILAWIVLALGILSTIGVWLGLSQLGNSLRTNFDYQGFFPSPFLAALPSLLIAVLIFLQFYVIGKVLQLMVDLDERTLVSQQDTQPASTAGVAKGAETEISGELNRQAKLIASNLEATQGLQQQFASLQARLSGLPASAAVAVPAAVEAAVTDATESAAKAAEAVQNTATDLT
jgi:hypothetical protein